MKKEEWLIFRSAYSIWNIIIFTFVSLWQKNYKIVDYITLKRLH